MVLIRQGIYNLPCALFKMKKENLMKKIIATIIVISLFLGIYSPVYAADTDVEPEDFYILAFSNLYDSVQVLQLKDFEGKLFISREKACDFSGFEWIGDTGDIDYFTKDNLVAEYEGGKIASEGQVWYEINAIMDALITRMAVDNGNLFFASSTGSVAELLKICDERYRIQVLMDEDGQEAADLAVVIDIIWNMRLDAIVGQYDYYQYYDALSEIVVSDDMGGLLEVVETYDDEIMSPLSSYAEFSNALLNNELCEMYFGRTDVWSYWETVEAYKKVNKGMGGTPSEIMKLMEKSVIGNAGVECYMTGLAYMLSGKSADDPFRKAGNEIFDRYVHNDAQSGLITMCNALIENKMKEELKDAIKEDVIKGVEKGTQDYLKKVLNNLAKKKTSNFSVNDFKALRSGGAAVAKAFTHWIGKKLDKDVAPSAMLATYDEIHRMANSIIKSELKEARPDYRRIKYVLLMYFRCGEKAYEGFDIPELKEAIKARKEICKEYEKRLLAIRDADILQNENAIKKDMLYELREQEISIAIKTYSKWIYESTSYGKNINEIEYAKHMRIFDEENNVYQIQLLELDRKRLPHELWYTKEAELREMSIEEIRNSEYGSFCLEGNYYIDKSGVLCIDWGTSVEVFYYRSDNGKQYFQKISKTEESRIEYLENYADISF